MSKITLLLDCCWVVRGVSPGPYRKGEYSYWVVANEWNASPAHCTIFPSEAAAQRQIDDARHHKRAGFNENCIVEAVPLEGAIFTGGTVVDVRKGEK